MHWSTNEQFIYHPVHGFIVVNIYAAYHTKIFTDLIVPLFAALNPLLLYAYHFIEHLCEVRSHSL